MRLNNMVHSVFLPFKCLHLVVELLGRETRQEEWRRVSVVERLFKAEDDSSSYVWFRWKMSVSPKQMRPAFEHLRCDGLKQQMK
ncbi:hypothetical protein NQZ68_026774 [Dissostichus eleginoides]|nr:hypothetical protein NQZ68_026774 [Dissostichus eleginoides]